jgi:hypothetical protein
MLEGVVTCKRPTESSANKVLPVEKWNEARNVPEHPYGSWSQGPPWCAVLVVELIEDVAASNPEFIFTTY